MEPITLAVVTTAVVTLALDAARDIVKDEVKNTWTKVKGLLGWAATPPPENLAKEVATALAANAATAEKILAELKAGNTGPASRLASRVSIAVANTTGTIAAGGKVIVVQAKDMITQGDMNIGGG